MKRLVIVIISMSVFFCNTEAQLIMDCDGNVGVDESSPLSTLAIGGPGSTNYKVNAVGTNGAYHCGLRGENPTTGFNSNYGVVGGIIYGESSGKAFGVYGVGWKGSTPTYGRSYGVYGYAGNATDGYNYGAYGYLVSDRDGAAVYGTLDGDYEVDGQYAGYFKGDVHIEGDLTVDGTYPSSDIKLKKDVRVIEEDVISKLEGLQVIRFKKKHYSEYKELSDTADHIKIAAELESERFTKDRIGLIAQELQLTFPEVVKVTNSGYLAVDYNQLIPILVKAITEQQVQIEELQAAIESGETLKGAAAKTVSPDLQSSEADISTLHQNAPNPFTEETTISYSLGETVGSATLFIYDMSGKQLRSYILHERGGSQINIIGGEFDAGMYMYSLVADGALIGTKQMILTD
jgi:hypothetical protein